MAKRQEYLVKIDVHWPPDSDVSLREKLIIAERERAAELVADGTIERLWRVPGRWANWGVWRAYDADELHNAIASLPFFPWLSVTVHPLAHHPSDPGPVEFSVENDKVNLDRNLTDG